MSTSLSKRRRGGPLLMLALLFGAWISARAALWESPFALPDTPAGILFAEAEPLDTSPASEQLAGLSPDPTAIGAASLVLASSDPRVPSAFAVPYYPQARPNWRGFTAIGQRPDVAIGHQMLMAAAFGADWHSSGLGAVFGSGQGDSGWLASTGGNAHAPFAPPAVAAPPGAPDRWSLDVFGYYRQGSGSLSTSQGRTPVYGASQIAANLQYRVAPSSRHDPRAFLRAYRAMVQDGETELAAGVSARPLGQIPLRLVGEMRATRTPQGTDYRPAGYAVTELAPQRLPLDFALESYGAAGYVGGEASTYFVDGQVAVTREVVTFQGVDGKPMRFSLGGATWGGMQEDAERLDVGPTLRLDLSVGEVPARISVDWRERVAGDAAPESGVAATVSTQF